jgi:hypothetical protein
VRLASTRQHRGIHDSVGGPQCRTRHAEQRLLDPELGDVFVSDLDVLADAEAAPEDAENIDAEEGVGPAFDFDVGAWEDEHPHQTADGRGGDGHECVDLRALVEYRTLGCFNYLQCKADRRYQARLLHGREDR